MSEAIALCVAGLSVLALGFLAGFVAGEVRGVSAAARTLKHTEVDFVFDGSPGVESPRFVECEDPRTHASIGVGRWVKLNNAHGYWALRVTVASPVDRHEYLRPPIAAAHVGVPV